MIFLKIPPNSSPSRALQKFSGHPNANYEPLFCVEAGHVVVTNPSKTNFRILAGPKNMPLPYKKTRKRKKELFNQNC